MNEHIRRAVNIRLVPMLLVVAVLVDGCSKSTPPGYDVAANLATGWSQFAAANYGSAKATFQDVLAHSSGNPEGSLGLGWALAFLELYPDAQASFRIAAASADFKADAQMGLAVVYRDLPNLDSSIIYCNRLIASDSNYSFSKRPTVNYLDAHLIKAECYFRKGTPFYDSVAQELNYLSTIEGLPLLPSPGTLTPQEYEDALLDRLQALSEILDHT